MKYFSTLLLVLVSLNFIVPSREQRITTIQLDGVQYFVSRMNPYSPELNFYLSYQYCRSLGLQLASFETREKADSIAQYLSNAGYTKYDFWTSGNKLGTDMFLWMSTGLPFNATFNYLKNRGDEAVQTDVVNSSTAPQRTARESSDSGSSSGCISLKAPSFEWSTDDCTAIKDFICEQTRCYYYNYGSIPVSSAQGSKPYFLEKVTSAKKDNKEPDMSDIGKTRKMISRKPLSRKSMTFDQEPQTTDASETIHQATTNTSQDIVTTERPIESENITSAANITTKHEDIQKREDIEDKTNTNKQHTVDTYINKIFDFLNIKLTTETPDEETTTEAAVAETISEKSYIDKLIEYYHMGLSTETPDTEDNDYHDYHDHDHDNETSPSFFDKFIEILHHHEKANGSLDIDSIPGYHDIEKLFQNTYTPKVTEKNVENDEEAESNDDEHEETTKKSLFEEFIDLYNTKTHDIQKIWEETYVQKVAEPATTVHYEETSDPDVQDEAHTVTSQKSVLEELFALYNNGRSFEEKVVQNDQNTAVASIMEKMSNGEVIIAHDFEKIPELRDIQKIAETVYLEKLNDENIKLLVGKHDQTTEIQSESTDVPVQEKRTEDKIKRSLAFGADLNDPLLRDRRFNLSKIISEMRYDKIEQMLVVLNPQFKHLQIGTDVNLDEPIQTEGPYETDGHMQDEPARHTISEQEQTLLESTDDAYVSTIAPEYVTTFKSVSYT